MNMKNGKDGAKKPPPFQFSPRSNLANEIHWQEWGPDAFLEAQREDKPIFLDISAVWCHWCHVMDETSFSNRQVIDLLNRSYISIRVDTDKHPEVNQRYNMGGWPSVAILTPDGEVLTGDTYLSPDDLQSLLSKVKEIYDHGKAEIRARIAEIERRKNIYAVQERASKPLTDQVVEHVTSKAVEAYDPIYGGFGTQPKFPQVDVLELVLWQFKHHGNDRLRKIAVKTLDAMSHGGMFDHIGGGFFRYATTRDWGVPHYEKMLEDNAALLAVYLQARQILHEPRYEETARRVVEYLEDNLRDPRTGAFYGSQDADEAHYKLPPAQRAKARAPNVDKTIYTNWNGMVATSLLEGYGILGEPRYQEMALETIEFLWQYSHQPGEGMYHYFNGEAHLHGLLTDQVPMARALVGAYEVTGHNIYLEHAEELVRFTIRRMGDKAEGGFFDAPQMPDALGRLRERDKPLNDNSAAAEVLTILYHLTGKEEYRALARTTLLAFLPEYQEHGLFAAIYARAVDRLLNAPVHITVVGDQKDRRKQALLASALSIAEPNKVVEPLDPVEDKTRLRQQGFSPSAVPRAYVCRAQSCLAAISEPPEVHAAVEGILHSSGF